MVFLTENLILSQHLHNFYGLSINSKFNDKIILKPGTGLITNVSLASSTTSEPREVKAQARIPTSTAVTQRAGSIVTFAQQQSHQNLRPTSAAALQAAKVSGRQLLNVSQVNTIISSSMISI